MVYHITPVTFGKPTYYEVTVTHRFDKPTITPATGVNVASVASKTKIKSPSFTEALVSSGRSAQLPSDWVTSQVSKLSTLINWTKAPSFDTLPSQPGIYALVDSLDNTLLYIGIARQSLLSRLSTSHPVRKVSKGTQLADRLAIYYDVFPSNNPSEFTFLHQLEKRLHKHFRPPYNGGTQYRLNKETLHHVLGAALEHYELLLTKRNRMLNQGPFCWTPR